MIAVDARKVDAGVDKVLCRLIEGIRLKKAA
jgi:hypothetical protein